MKAVKRLYINTTKDDRAPEFTVVEMTYGKSNPGLIRLHQDDFIDFIECLRHGFTEIIIRPS